MSLLAPWLVFPAVLGLLCLGAGLLVERLAGRPFPGQLLLPLGFAALVSVTQLTTSGSSTAEATLPVVLVVAVAGYALSIPRLRALRPQPWVLGLALVTYGIYAAPGVLWGSRTFLGYGNLGDAAIHFEIIDLLLTNGHSNAGVPESSFFHSVGSYFSAAYPTGGHSVLAVTRELVGVDVAWLFQPFLTCLAVLIVLGLEPLARELTDDRRLAAIGAGIAGQAGLVYGYAVHQEAIKELGAVAMIVLLVALVAPLLQTEPGWRAAIPLAIAVGGGIGVLSFAIAPWLGPILLAAAVVLVARHWRARRVALLAEVGVFVAIATVLAIPRLLTLNSFVYVNNVVLRLDQEFGNLQHRLDRITAFGVWPVPDFRSGPPPQNGLAIALVGVAVIAAILGVVTVIRRRSWRPALFATISLIAFVFVIARGASPWGEGKALMILSPALALLGVAGALGLVDRRRRAEGLVVLAALAAGVLWTNAQAYHAVDGAPYDRLGELETIGERFAGQGPSFYPEFEEYAKHFLRDTAPTGAVEPFRPAWPVAEAGVTPRFGYSSDIGEWQPASLAEHFELLVLRQGPNRSRPPLGWRRVFHGKYYDVWRRQEGAPRVLGQVVLGDRFDAGRRAPCGPLRKLAGVARAGGGELAYVERPLPVIFVPTQAGAPANWGPDGSDNAMFRPLGPGRVVGEVKAPPGDYVVWFEASAQRAATIFVDDQRIGALEDQLNPRWSATRLGTVRLSGGRHAIRMDVGGGDLEPGNGGVNRLLGPITLDPVADLGTLPVRTLPPARWRSLCGRHLDWVQAVAPA